MQGLQPLYKGLPVPDLQRGKIPQPAGIVVPELTVGALHQLQAPPSLWQAKLCGVCQFTCPDQAIHWVEEEPYEPHKVAIEY